jgi:hypothetical protein
MHVYTYTDTYMHIHVYRNTGIAHTHIYNYIFATREEVMGAMGGRWQMKAFYDNRGHGNNDGGCDNNERTHLISPETI